MSILSIATRPDLVATGSSATALPYNAASLPLRRDSRSLGLPTYAHFSASIIARGRVKLSVLLPSDSADPHQGPERHTDSSSHDRWREQLGTTSSISSASSMVSR